MGDGPPGKAVDPQAAVVQRGVRRGVSVECACEDVPGGEGAGVEGVVDAFAGEGLDDAGCVADVEDTVAQRANGGAVEGSDGAPLLAGRDGEAGGDGGFEGVEAGWGGDETEVCKAFADGSDAAVALREEVEFDAGRLAGGSGDVGLEGDAIAPRGGGDAQETGDCGVAAIGGDEAAGGEGAIGGLEAPEGGVAGEGVERGAVEDNGPGLFGTLEKDGVEDAARDCDFAGLSGVEGEVDAAEICADEGDAGDRVMRGGEYGAGDAQLLEEGPATGIHAIAADFVSRENAFFQYEGVQAGLRAKGGAGCARGATADDGHVVCGRVGH